MAREQMRSAAEAEAHLLFSLEDFSFLLPFGKIASDAAAAGFHHHDEGSLCERSTCCEW